VCEGFWDKMVSGFLTDQRGVSLMRAAGHGAVEGVVIGRVGFVDVVAHDRDAGLEDWVSGLAKGSS